MPNRYSETRTFGSKTKVDSGLKPRDELATDIHNMRNIYQKDGVYTNEMKDNLINAIHLNKQKFPNIFKKGE